MCLNCPESVIEVSGMRKGSARKMSVSKDCCGSVEKALINCCGIVQEQQNT